MRHLNFWAFNALVILLEILTGATLLLEAVFLENAPLRVVLWVLSVVVFFRVGRWLSRVRDINSELFMIDYLEKVALREMEARGKLWLSEKTAKGWSSPDEEKDALQHLDAVREDSLAELDAAIKRAHYRLRA